MDELDVNTPAGLPTNPPDIQSELVLSRKYFIDEDILPNRVGLPRIRPSQLVKSSVLTSKPSWSEFDQSPDTDTCATVRIMA